MRKSLLLIMALAIVFSFSACKKDEAGNNVTLTGGVSYAGTYKGTYTYFKYVDNQEVQDGEPQGDKSVPVTQLTDNQIYLYGVLPLTKVSEGKFATSALSGELLQLLFQAIGLSDNIASQAKNVSFEAVFTGTGHMSYRLYYELEISTVIGISIDVNILKFEGDK